MSPAKQNLVEYIQAICNDNRIARIYFGAHQAHLISASTDHDMKGVLVGMLLSSEDVMIEIDTIIGVVEVDPLDED